MAKYHVKKDGTPGVCHAQEGNCPLGDSSQHFSSKEEAQDYADKINEGLAQSQNESITNEQKEKFNKFLKEKNIDLGSGSLKIDPDNLEPERTPLYNEILKENGEEPIFNQDREYSRNAIKSMEVLRALNNRAKDNIEIEMEYLGFDETKKNYWGGDGSYISLTYEESLTDKRFTGEFSSIIIKDKNSGLDYEFIELDSIEDEYVDSEYANKQEHKILEDIQHGIKRIDTFIEEEAKDETVAQEYIEAIADEKNLFIKDEDEYYELTDDINKLFDSFNPDKYKSNWESMQNGSYNPFLKDKMNNNIYKKVKGDYTGHEYDDLWDSEAYLEWKEREVMESLD